MKYEIFKTIPHRRVVSKQGNDEEIFDLYQCGLFNNHATEENVELVALQPESAYQTHYHEESAAVIYIISGIGIFQLAEKFINYKPGMRFTIPAAVLHGFTTKTHTLFLSIQSPPIINTDSGNIDLHYQKGDIHAKKCD
ncbi:MAG: cupin domain-containing protein [Gammaproteobacteria bacterium]|nr:cupin domain-containing protein [Gammaproteobacteria bacterium]